VSNARRSSSGSTPAPTSPVAVVREGQGPELLLVHGGASPQTTWSPLAPLSNRWTLALVHRRGFPPSPPPPGGRQDFELDAADLEPLLHRCPHVVGHSYGAVGAVLASIRRPGQVRSLTLLEPALFLPADDPEVAGLRKLGEACLTHGLDTEPTILRAFLKLAGAPVPDVGPLPPEVARGVERAHGSRHPAEANPPLEVLRDARLPVLVVSGAHHPAMERMCDAVADALCARRVVTPGADHFVTAAPGFTQRLEEFLIAAEDAGPDRQERPSPAALEGR
jgi:pimeloyl-ACP methyl ester carboxylesterase